MDIIRPTIGWHEGAKMVREQVFLHYWLEDIFATAD